MRHLVIVVIQQSNLYVNMDWFHCSISKVISLGPFSYSLVANPFLFLTIVHYPFEQSVKPAQVHILNSLANVISLAYVLSSPCSPLAPV